jgi:acetylglutamate kinase
VKLALKLSGKVLDEPALRRALGRQAASLAKAGHQLVLIHGAGKQLSDFCREHGIPVRQIQGRRITGADTLQAAVLVFSGVNADLTVALLAAGVQAVGVAGFAGGLTIGRRRPPLKLVLQGPEGPQEQVVDFGLVGEILETRPHLVELLWSSGVVPVISSLCAEGDQILNINADTLASELAVALRADRLIAVSDVEGIYRDPSVSASRIPRMTAAEARRHLAEGIFQEGMVPKVENALRILDRGVPEFQVISGMGEDLARCLEEGTGTLLVA